LSFFCWS